MSERKTDRVQQTLLPGQRIEDCTVLVVEGPDKGKTVLLSSGRLEVGADGSCDLVLTDSTVSRFHAELSLAPEGIRVRDHGSRNGVIYMGVRIDRAVVQPGAVLVLGSTQIAIQPPRSVDSSLSSRTEYGPLVGCSTRLRQLFSLLERIESSEITVLLLGETGTGKSVIAQAIHERSPRGNGPFVTVDCGAVSPSLLQSELFGHRRGAFTGAVADHDGALVAADRGTLFLDEVGELPLPLQPVLLRFLETGSFVPVGNAVPRSADARIIAATNRDLAEAVRQGSFRLDLYYRLNVLPVQVPALRECPEDIVPIARRFLAELKVTADLSPAAIALLCSYSWPGNARQLRNVVERYAVTGSLLEDIAPLPAATGSRAEDFHRAKAELIERFELSYLEELMLQHHGNLSAASRASGLVRHHLRALLKKHKLVAGKDPDDHQ